jgi:transcriptional regulator with XRE-family HTH domain
MNNLATEIGNRIIKKRKEKNLKQKDMIDLLDGATNQMLSNWENGHSIPTATYIIKLAKILDTTTDYLLTGIENIKSEEIYITTYKDAIECIIALTSSKLFKNKIYKDFDNYLVLESNNSTLFDFLNKFNKLETVKDIITPDVFNQELKNLIQRYDSKIISK